MMTAPRILIQLDSDPQASVFDAVVAVDSNVDHLLQYANVTAQTVLPLVHGAMFTRGPDRLKNTAIFVGGSQVDVGEAVAAEIQKAFFGPIRVSVMLDGNGSNTTAAAAVLSAARHVDLTNTVALVLGGTGPVGSRVARLLLKTGASVLLASRNLARAQQSLDSLLQTPELLALNDSKPQIRAVETGPSLEEHLPNVTTIFGCGAAGSPLLSAAQLQSASATRVAIDLNAVPPAGLEGIEAMDKAKQRGRRIDYGAIGVGGLKMKLHRAAIEKLFSSNNQFLNTFEIFELGQTLESERQN